MVKIKVIFNLIIGLIIGLIIFFSLSNLKLSAQQSPSWYLVYFKNKNNTQYQLSNPTEFLSQKSIARRVKAQIQIDSADIPVNKSYVDSLISFGVKVKGSSKWLNASLVHINDTSEITKIENCEIVEKLEPVAPNFTTTKRYSGTQNDIKKSTTSSTVPKINTIENYGVSQLRINMIGLEPLMKLGLAGKNIDIAVFDDGFQNVNKIDPFRHLFDNGQIICAKNIINDTISVFDVGFHGTGVLSTLGGYIKDSFIGSSIDANYALFKTESDNFEYKIEEVYWLFAAEYSDSIGIDIITSSLTYTNDDKSLLNGDEAIVTHAASMAADKGILVFNSAGNEGNSPWRKICFPADAKNIISVGSVDKNCKYSNFSSVGNTEDGRIKPELMALGENAPLISPQNKIIYSSGTSFSNPFLAGAAATLMQALPTLTAQEIRELMLMSASNYKTPDSIFGFGIPNMYLAYLLEKNKEIRKESNDISILTMPNPFTNSFYIIYNATKDGFINTNIYDIQGKIVWKKEQISCLKGKNIYFIDGLEKMVFGTYILEIQSDKKYTQKIIKTS